MQLKASEADHQKAVVAWARMQGIKYLFAVPNGAMLGGKNRWAMVNHLKAMGLSNGVPDLFLPWPIGRSHGLWIEMKAGNNKPSPEQDQWREFLVKQGYDYSTCWTAEAAIESIKTYLEIE